MGQNDAFLSIGRQEPDKQPVAQRLGHFKEIYLEMPEDKRRKQASRCMECGVPFCHSYGCPLGNLIPEWNDLVFRGRWREACERLHYTNNFPEITGRICPAPCEAACTLGIDEQAVTIRQNECSIVERGFKEGWIAPQPPEKETGRKVAVVGSGPAGMAAAQQLRRAGHQVTLFEKDSKAGGILRYGIPDFKLEKWVLDRRLGQMKGEGVILETDVNVGVDMSAGFLKKRFDAVCICIGAGAPRDLPAPGRELDGVHFAMDFLTQQNRRLAGEEPGRPEINAKGKKVVIIGGGDTGADCLGTALRQGAVSVHQFEILPKPPASRSPKTPWPTWPDQLRTSTSHQEGGHRRWCVATSEFLGRGGRLTGLKGREVRWVDAGQGPLRMEPVEGTEFELQADLALLAMGFTRPRHKGFLDELGVEYDERGNVRVDGKMMTSVEGVFAAGDAQTGAWLVVRAIAAGRRMAREVDLYLMGQTRLAETVPPPA